MSDRRDEVPVDVVHAPDGTLDPANATEHALAKKGRKTAEVPEKCPGNVEGVVSSATIRVTDAAITMRDRAGKNLDLSGVSLL